jgi:hypothetical protein
MASIFQNLEIEAFRAGINPRTQESRDWFRKRISALRGGAMRRINRNQLLRDEELTLENRAVIGNMYMFFYDPKHKDTLPYYDGFPLVIPIGPAEKGFLGLNLHYLPPVLRAKLLDGLMDTTNNKRFDESTKFNIKYQQLKSASNLRYFKPCVKHYLNSNVRSRYAKVDSPEWEIAAFLPTASWNKSSGSAVYRASRKMI